MLGAVFQVKLNGIFTRQTLRVGAFSICAPVVLNRGAAEPLGAAKSSRGAVNL